MKYSGSSPVSMSSWKGNESLAGSKSGDPSKPHYRIKMTPHPSVQTQVHTSHRPQVGNEHGLHAFQENQLLFSHHLIRNVKFYLFFWGGCFFFSLR